MLKYLVFLLFISTPLFAQSTPLLPRLYTVTGVAADDTLNIRESPSASAQDIGDLLPGQRIEVLAVSNDGKWGQVSKMERTGWVSTRFLTLVPQSDSTNQHPTGLPSKLSCYGTEPFWGMEVAKNAEIAFSPAYAGDSIAQHIRILGMARPFNTGPNHFGFTAGQYTGVIRREYCDDGMSDNEYGWSLDIVFPGDGGITMLHGCCSITAP